MSSVFDVMGALVLTDIVLEDGKSENGGCLFVHSDGEFDAKVRIVNSLLRGCVAISMGGAAFVSGARASLVLEGSAVHGNSAGQGGAFCIDDRAVLNITSSSSKAETALMNNTAAKIGGGIFLREDNTIVTISGGRTRVTIGNNKAGQAGGGMFLDAGD